MAYVRLDLLKVSTYMLVTTIAPDSNLHHGLGSKVVPHGAS